MEKLGPLVSAWYGYKCIRGLMGSYWMVNNSLHGGLVAGVIFLAISLTPPELLINPFPVKTRTGAGIAIFSYNWS